MTTLQCLTKPRLTMKTLLLKKNKFLIFFIYIFAFILMTWTFNAHANKAKDLSSKDLKPKITMATSLGNIIVQLNREKAPISTDNFLNYVEKKQYDNTIFHRVIKDFMIQGGGFTADMKEKSTLAPIKNEAQNKLSNKRGTIAMARTNDPDSATAQFFINTVDNPNLDASPSQAGYAVFGEVIEGMDVVDKIREVKTGTKGDYSDVPTETVLIKSIRKGKK